MFTRYTTLPRTNGNRHPAGRFDDGIPDRHPGDPPPAATTVKKKAPEPPPVAPADDDFEGENRRPPPPEPPEPRPGVKVLPNRPKRQSTKLLTCDRLPGRTLTMREAAEIAGTQPSVVYQGAYRNCGVNGYRFAFAPGHAPNEKPRHVPRPDAGGESAGKPAKAGKTRATPKGPSAPAPATPATTAPACVSPLQPAELAALAAALSRGSGRVDAKDAEALFRWAAETRAESARLQSLLDGTGEAFVADRVYVRPVKK